ncbi:MAG: zinc-dependent alcohol dehydrogenase family protein [Rhizobiales bacterium]|nr:zinc-dependent alcohol dehydrogenase family protein [Hyphomicrobiales bacterium]
MKQVQFAAFGDPAAVVSCVDVPDLGPPGAGEVVVTVDAFPINPADLLTIAGGYAVKPDLPATLGAEATGRITAIGSRVDDLKIGDRVIILARDNWCQQRRLPAGDVIKVPGDADVLQLAMLKVNPATAWMLLHHYVRLDADDWVIQDAANSGVGLALISLARTKGLRTVNVVRRPGLSSRLQALGADIVVVDGDDLAARVADATGQAPIRLAIDAVGGGQVMRLADCLAEGGTVVNYGLLSGEPCQIRADQTIFKGVTLTGFWLQRMLTSMARPAIENLYATLAEHVRAGELAVDVEATYPIEQIKAAVAHAGRDHRQGKILVLPHGDGTA